MLTEKQKLAMALFFFRLRWCTLPMAPPAKGETKYIEDLLVQLGLAKEVTDPEVGDTLWVLTPEAREELHRITSVWHKESGKANEPDQCQ